MKEKVRPAYIILALPTIIFGFLLGISIRNLSANINIDQISFGLPVVLSLLSIILLGVFSGIYASLVSDLSQLLIVFISTSLVYILGTTAFDLVGLLSCLLLLGILLIYAYLVRSQLERFVNFDKSGIFVGSFKKFFLASSLILAINFYFDLRPVASTSAVDLSRRTIRTGVEQALEKLEVVLDKSFGPQIGLMKGLTFEEVTVTQEGKIDLSGLVDKLTEQIQQAIAPFMKYLPLALSLILFVATFFVSGLISLVALLLIDIFYWLFLSLGLVKIETQTKEVKRPVLK